jgi:hypothetical protein
MPTTTAMTRIYHQPYGRAESRSICMKHLAESRWIALICERLRRGTAVIFRSWELLVEATRVGYLPGGKKVAKPVRG